MNLFSEKNAEQLSLLFYCELCRDNKLIKFLTLNGQYLSWIPADLQSINAGVLSKLWILFISKIDTGFLPSYKIYDNTVIKFKITWSLSCQLS